MIFGLLVQDVVQSLDDLIIAGVEIDTRPFTRKLKCYPTLEESQKSLIL